MLVSRWPVPQDSDFKGSEMASYRSMHSSRSDWDSSAARTMLAALALRNRSSSAGAAAAAAFSDRRRVSQPAHSRRSRPSSLSLPVAAAAMRFRKSDSILSSRSSAASAASCIARSRPSSILLVSICIAASSLACRASRAVISSSAARFRHSQPPQKAVAVQSATTRTAMHDRLNVPATGHVLHRAHARRRDAAPNLAPRDHRRTSSGPILRKRPASHWRRPCVAMRYRTPLAALG